MWSKSLKEVLRTVYLLLTLSHKGETYLMAFHADVSICFFLRCLYTVHARYRNDTNFISFQWPLIFLTIVRQMAEVFWCKMNRTDHRMFGCCPFLPCDVYEDNPLLPFFLGFWSVIMEKWYLIYRDTYLFSRLSYQVKSIFI